VDDNNLKLSDINRLNDVFTYCNDAGTATSWIDHVVCSSTVDKLTVWRVIVIFSITLSVLIISRCLSALTISVLILAYSQTLHQQSQTPVNIYTISLGVTQQMSVTTGQN